MESCVKKQERSVRRARRFRPTREQENRGRTTDREPPAFSKDIHTIMLRASVYITGAHAHCILASILTFMQ